MKLPYSAILGMVALTFVVIAFPAAAQLAGAFGQGATWLHGVIVAAALVLVTIFALMMMRGGMGLMAVLPLLGCLYIAANPGEIVALIV